MTTYSPECSESALRFYAEMCAGKSPLYLIEIGTGAAPDGRRQSADDPLASREHARRG
jgi:hypothetical protein